MDLQVPKSIQNRRRRKLKKHNCWCMSFYSIFFLSFVFNDIFNLTWCYEKAWPFCQRKKIWNDNDVLGPKRKLLAMTSIYRFDNFLNILNKYYQQRFCIGHLWFISYFDGKRKKTTNRAEFDFFEYSLYFLVVNSDACWL